MGDDEGFHEFVSSRSPALLRTAYLLLGDWELAEDLVQTALAKAYQLWTRLVASSAPEWSTSCPRACRCSHAETIDAPVLSSAGPVRQDRRLCASSWSGPGSSA